MSEIYYVLKMFFEGNALRWLRRMQIHKKVQFFMSYHPAPASIANLSCYDGKTSKQNKMICIKIRGWKYKQSKVNFYMKAKVSNNIIIVSGETLCHVLKQTFCHTLNIQARAFQRRISSKRDAFNFFVSVSQGEIINFKVFYTGLRTGLCIKFISKLQCARE